MTKDYKSDFVQSTNFLYFLGYKCHNGLFISPQARLSPMATNIETNGVPSSPMANASNGANGEPHHLCIGANGYRHWRH